MDLTATVGPLRLRSPLIAAAGTVGSVVEWAGVADTRPYGAAVAKSVSGTPWEGRPAPRIAPAGPGMLNGIGIQNPGIEQWVEDFGARLVDAGVPVWGSAVGETAEEFALVARGLASAGVEAIEVNLSCPNLEGGGMFALDAAASAGVVAAVRAATDQPIGAKLSPNSEHIADVAEACAAAGADFVVLTNTVWGAAIDLDRRRPVLSGTIGGYSGEAIKPIALRCVMEVHERIPALPIVGCGGVQRGEDIAEYLIAGASAVEAGTVHFADPGAGKRIIREFTRFCARRGIERAADLVGTMEAW